MEYGSKGSFADAYVIAEKLKTVFKFSNAVNGANNGKDIGAGLAGMINPNLDAEHPVLLALMGSGGHAVVADGYGYDLSATDPDAVPPPEHGLGRDRRHVVQPAGRRQVQFRRRLHLQRLPLGQRRDHQRASLRTPPAGRLRTP